MALTKTREGFFIHLLSLSGMNSSNLLRLQKAKTKEASWVDMSIRLTDLRYIADMLLLDRDGILKKQLTDTLQEAEAEFDKE